MGKAREESVMSLFRTLMLCVLLAGLVACQKEEAPAQPAQTEVKAPVDGDDKAWREYLTAVAKQYIGRGEGRLKPYVTYLRAGEDPARHIEQSLEFIARGMEKGTLLIFASPDSAFTADVISQIFTQAKPEDAARLGRNGVQMLFVGAAADEAKVREAIAVTGMQLRFHETK
jgi:hypothetical protein